MISLFFYRVFPLKFSLRPPRSVEGLGREFSVDELLECDGILSLGKVRVPTERGLAVVTQKEIYGNGGTQ